MEALSDPGAYPHRVGEVSVLHTHISVVFLAGDFAYKVKKPVDLGFLDFTTLERRRTDCEEEVRLNRRLAPTVYLGVVPIIRLNGRVRVGGGGPAFEYAVKMKRLPEEATLRARLARGKVERPDVDALGRRVAAFHLDADSDEEIAGYGRFEVVAGNARENFDQTEPFRGQTVSRRVWSALKELTESRLSEHRDLIERRARPGVIRDTHGDLHLEHVYCFPDREPPEDLVILDCLEFNRRFRYADPVSDVAFLVMDLEFHARSDLARAFADAYFEASGDAEGEALLPYYAAYRAVIRGKVESLELREDEVPEGQRWQDLQRARAHFLLALGRLAPAAERPALVLAVGLPGTGKSRLSRGLAERAGFVRFSSDEVRKELAGLRPEESAAAPLDEGLYSPEWTERVYAVCLERAEEALYEGRRAVVDASFQEEAKRRAYLDAARAWGVPAVLLICETPAEQVRRRIERRGEGAEASDADWEIYRAVAERWEEPEEAATHAMRRIDTSGAAQESLQEALAALGELGLA